MANYDTAAKQIDALFALADGSADFWWEGNKAGIGDLEYEWDADEECWSEVL